jgi:hypothetical protein
MAFQSCEPYQEVALRKECKPHNKNLAGGESSFLRLKSAVNLGHKGTCLIVRKNRGHFPIQALGPFGSVFVAGISIICFHQNPTFY